MRAIAVTAFKDSPRTAILRFAAQGRMVLIFFFSKTKPCGQTDTSRFLYFSQKN
jgi:hypothetical protein